MWKLEKVKARNICAFEELDYTIGQGHTTLIFGNNMDNDSQPSNGSGKSALIEAISIGLTGDVLRDIKSAEEIINDAADEAEIIITLLDEERIFTIERHLFRKSAQTIKLTMNELGEEIELPCSSVAEYNKEVLRQIGLTKDEIFSNIILSKHKYKSFLSSSDKDKKEIINRFSNGIVVDEAIEALHADIEPVTKELTEAQMLVSEKTGQVNVLSEQINEFKQTSLSNKQTKEEKIESNKKLIAEQRALIRQKESEIGELNSQYDRLDDVDDECQRLDKDQDLDMSQCYKSIVSKFAEYNKKCSEDSQLHLRNDYLKKADDYKKELKDTAEFSREIEKSLKAEESSLKKEQANYAKLKTKYNKFMETYGTKSEKIQAKINDIYANIKSVEDSIKSLRSQKQNLEKDVATLNAQLAGVVVCPKCKHEFTLSDDVDIDGVRKKLQDRQGEIKDIDNTISDNYKTLDTCDSDKSSQRALSDKLTSKKSQLFASLSDSKNNINKLSTSISNLNVDLTKLNAKVDNIEKSIDNLIVDMLDEAFNLIDSKRGKLDDIILNLDKEVKNAEGTIKSLKDANNDLLNVSETDVLKSMESKKEKCQKEYEDAVKHKDEIESKLNQLKQQDAYFVEFKTHLANSKIDALGHITNEFLEAIGSDIRIQFSGFTVLKSGKVRDKISISLLRDGVDCGSFGKFSEGEKTRVSLASILAMHKLTNLNCDPGKGLDLLILDEILDACDEGGLDNTFEALNQLEITSLVVSHGNIAEGYPYRTVVNKQNGVSYIND